MSARVRVFIADNLSVNLKIIIKDNLYHYLINVTRQKLFNEIFLVNGKDGEFLGKIEKITKKEVEILVVKKTRDFKSNKFVSLIYSPIAKIDLLVNYATQMGVTDFFPVTTEYSNVNHKEKKTLANIIEAVEQSERLDVPVVHKQNKLLTLLEEVTSNPNNIIIFACERGGGAPTIKDVFENNSLRDKNIYLLIGGEGGFSEKEKNTIPCMQNVFPISLGNLILRSETAVVSALSQIRLMTLDINM